MALIAATAVGCSGQSRDPLGRWQTQWTFTSNGRCHFERITTSLVEGFSRTVARDCGYVDRGHEAAVTFTDQTTAVLPYSVPLNSNRFLIIEGLQYERVG